MIQTVQNPTVMSCWEVSGKVAPFSMVFAPVALGGTQMLSMGSQSSNSNRANKQNVAIYMKIYILK